MRLDEALGPLSMSWWYTVKTRALRLLLIVFGSTQEMRGSKPARIPSRYNYRAKHAQYHSRFVIAVSKTCVRRLRRRGHDERCEVYSMPNDLRVLRQGRSFNFGCTLGLCFLQKTPRPWTCALSFFDQKVCLRISNKHTRRCTTKMNSNFSKCNVPAEVRGHSQHLYITVLQIS